MRSLPILLSEHLENLMSGILGATGEMGLGDMLHSLNGPLRSEQQTLLPDDFKLRTDKCLLLGPAQVLATQILHAAAEA